MVQYANIAAEWGGPGYRRIRDKGVVGEDISSLAGCFYWRALDNGALAVLVYVAIHASKQDHPYWI